jgi:hypothetical protein
LKHSVHMIMLRCGLYALVIGIAYVVFVPHDIQWSNWIILTGGLALLAGFVDTAISKWLSSRSRGNRVQ